MAGGEAKAVMTKRKGKNNEQFVNFLF